MLLLAANAYAAIAWRLWYKYLFCDEKVSSVPVRVSVFWEACCLFCSVVSIAQGTPLVFRPQERLLAADACESVDRRHVDRGGCVSQASRRMKSPNYRVKRCRHFNTIPKLYFPKLTAYYVFPHIDRMLLSDLHHVTVAEA